MQLTAQTLLLFPLVLVTLAKFPVHDPEEDKIILRTSNDLDPRDHPSCGLFKNPDPGRIYNGEEGQVSQFPWEVCFIEPHGALESLTNGHRVALHPTDPILNDRDIFNYGYEFSKKSYATSIGVKTITDWAQYCTGTIIDSKWIVTAAHCFEDLWEGSFVVVSAGSVECLRDDWDDKLMREVIVYRQEGSKYRTIFEHPGWLLHHEPANQEHWHDMALVRLQKEYDLPQVYTDEPINRICLYSMPKSLHEGCLNNVYFAGYGQKGKYKFGEESGQSAELTWTRYWRTSASYCELMARDKELYRSTGPCISCDKRKFDHGYCYTTVLEHFDTKITRFNELQLNVTFAQFRTIPNVCKGDSGGGFVHFMRDEIGGRGQGVGGLKYRALLVGTLYGMTRAPEKGFECAAQKFPDSKRRYYKLLTRGPSIPHQIETTWWNETLMNTNASKKGPLLFAYAKYPKVTTIWSPVTRFFRKYRKWGK